MGGLLAINDCFRSTNTVVEGDFDNYLSTGSYTIGDISGINNAPNMSLGQLISFGVSNGYAMQIALNYTAGDIGIRARNTDGSWSNWRYLVTK